MDLQQYVFQGAEVRTYLDNRGNAWFVGKDVAAILGYEDTVNAIKQHCKGKAAHTKMKDNLGRTQEVRVLSEPDMLRLVINSNLPAAQRFEAWVFEEVLPSIRKGGGYISTTATPDQLQALQAQITTLQEEHKRNLASLNDFHESALRNLRHAAEAASKKTSRTYGPAEELAKQVTLLQREMKGVEVQNTLAEKILEKVYEYPPEKIHFLLDVRKKVADDRERGPSKKISGFMPWTPRSIADLELYATEQL